MVCHANAGYTLLPNVESTGEDNIVYHHTYSFVNLGASVIWLMTYRTNLMFEGLYNILHDAGESGGYGNSWPGNYQSGHPACIRFKKSADRTGNSRACISYKMKDAEFGLFFYLSFEHPF